MIYYHCATADLSELSWRRINNAKERLDVEGERSTIISYVLCLAALISRGRRIRCIWMVISTFVPNFRQGQWIQLRGLGADAHISY